MIGFKTFTFEGVSMPLPGRPWKNGPCDFIAPDRIRVADRHAYPAVGVEDALRHYRVWGRRSAKLVNRSSKCSATYRMRWFGFSKVTLSGDWRMGKDGCELVGAAIVKGNGPFPVEVRNC